ncbi:MAG: SusC/RagA family TonB-linked outer membrane protein [Bacteroidia bacterium]
MKSKFTWIFTLLLAFFIQFSFAQKRTITGTVTDDKGMALPAATVMVSGVKPGVQTDYDGKYSIQAAPGDKLEFVYIGFTTQIVKVGNSATIDVQLKEDVKVIGEVVVDSYRTISRPKSASAVAVVTSKTIEGRPNASFVQTLQGQVPGLNISSGSGQPGSNNTTVILRGAGSVNGNIEPLYVIDGVPQNSDNFRSINPADIESVSVLKDAGATAIYGNRGANGVIVVKTKRANFESNLTVKYIGQTGFSQMQKNDYRLMNSQQLLGVQRVYDSGGRGVTMTDAEIASARSYDWTDFFYRTGVTQNHQLALTAGSKNLSSYTSLGFTDMEGILKGSDLKRFNFRSNLSGKSNDDKFNYSTVFTANFSRSNLVSSLGTGGVNQNYVVGALQAVPYLYPEAAPTPIAATNPTRQYPGAQWLVDQGANLEYTPWYLQNKLSGFTNFSEEVKGIGQLQASYKITPDLVAATQFGIDYTQINGLSVVNPDSFNGLYFRSSGQQYGGTQSESFSRSVALTTTTSLSYSKTFAEKHTFEAAAYTEYLRGLQKSFGYTQNGLNPIFYADGTANGWVPFQSSNTFYVPGASAGKATAGLFSYFGTADYDYDSKYGVSATVRRDASYRFTGDNRWGTFWSASARWNLDQEKFMEGSVFKLLKLRASYGTSGNQDIYSTGVFGAASLTRPLYGQSSGYNNNPGYVLTQLPNDKLQWEVIGQANVGVDFEVFESKLRGTVDLYNKKTTDLLQSIPTSAINGSSEIPSNFGSLSNKGIEVKVDYDIIRTADARLTVNFNGSYNKNKMLDLPNETGNNWDGESLNGIREGGPLYEYYMLRYAGVNPANGNLLFFDKDNNVTENPQTTDRVWTNKSLYPRYQGGFGLDAEYKGFFATAMFTYVYKAWRLDQDYQSLMDPTDLDQFNKSQDLLRYWTPDNRVTDVPALYAENAAQGNDSDRFLVDSSYLRLRYLSVGYNFNKSLLDGTPFSTVRVYGQAENLLTWSKWRGFDAESNRAGDFAQYPTPKMFTFGLEVQF